MTSANQTASNGRPSVAGVVLARTDSSRLPGKVLTPVLGRPVVGYVFERAAKASGLRGLALATTDRPADDELARYAASLGVPVFRGDVDDVAGRVLACAEDLGVDYALRLNGDSPFLDPHLIEQGLELLAENPDVVTSVRGKTFPYGVSVEIVRVAALAQAHQLMTPDEREHVTAHFYRNADRYRISELTSPAPELAAARMVVDNEDDLRAFEAVIAQLGDDALSADFRRVAPYYLELGRLR